jgi:septum formation protein
MNLQGIDLVLASASPRRKELLEKARIPFTLHPAKVSENLEENLRAKLTFDEQIIEIARRKASWVLAELKSLRNSPFFVVGADTLVLIDDLVLGKPEDSNDAVRTLSRLSGQWHQVKTSIILIHSASHFETAGVETTRVKFKTLTQKQIEDYVATGDPLDKAGSYGIQTLERDFVETIDGRLDNVIGFSMELFTKLVSQQRNRK